MLLALEPRIMFDGAALATGAEVVQEQITQDHDLQDINTVTEPETFTDPFTNNIDLLSALSTDTAPSDRKEIVFIDTRVEDYQTLMEGIDPNAEVILLDSTRDGVEQIAEALNGRTDIDAIHLIAEGNEAELHLGTTFLTQEAISGRYANLFAQIGQSLSAEADWLIYGCNFGQGEAGLSAVQTLAELTGADIAASTDLTGSTELGGDWDLEYTTGSIETVIAIGADTQQNWDGLLAAITVNTFNDLSDGGDTSDIASLIATPGTDGISLREAIIATNNDAGQADDIFLGTGTYTLALGVAGENFAAGGDLDIRDDLTIHGTGAGVTIIDGGGLDRVFHILNNSSATITDVTIQNGDQDNGGGIFVDTSSTLNLSDSTLTGNTHSGAGSGGAIHVHGTAHLTDVLLSGNTADDGGAIGYHGAVGGSLTNVTISGNTTTGNGGGIWNDSNITVTNSTINGNSANLGGGIYNEGTIDISNTTVSGNMADTGAGIYNDTTSISLTITNVTVSGNTATSAGGGLYTERPVTMANSTFTLNSADSGGGIRTQGPGNVDLLNTIVAGNTGVSANPDLEGNFTTSGFNLIGDGTGQSDLVNGASNDQVGSSGSPINPLLGGLADNGGLTQTHALQTGSSAIDAGTATGAPANDQRGVTRDATPDIGAFESLALVSSSEFMVNDPSVQNEETEGLLRGAERAVDISPNGDYVVVWLDTTDNDKVFAKVLDKDGNEKVAQFQVNTIVGTTDNAGVAMDDSGNFVVTWTNSPGGGDIFMRRFQADGTAVDLADVTVNTSTTQPQDNPSIGMNGSGNFVIAWKTNNPGNDAITVRQGSFAGGLIGSDINITLAVAAEDPSVDINDDGKFVVVWQEGNEPQAQRFAADGTKRGSAIDINPLSSSLEQHPVVAVQSSGDFVVAYRSDIGPFSGVWMKRYQDDGTAYGIATRVSSGTSHVAPSIGMDASGNYTIVYEGDGDGSGKGVFGHSYNSDGSEQGAEFQVNQTTANAQDHASVAMLDQNNFVVVWTGSDGAQTDVFARQFGTAINTAPTLDLDADDSSGATGNDYQFTFTEGDGPTAIADSDTDLVDIDSTTFDHVTVSVSGLLDGNAESLLLDGDPFAMARAIAGQDTTGGNYHVVITTGAGTATVTITKQGGGTFTETETETLIKAIQYWHSDPNNPTDGDRLIDVTVNDGTADSAAARTTINVNPVVSGPTNLTFQQDTGGYIGTVDTYVQSDLPNNDNSASPTLFADGTLVAQQLIRFDNIFGPGPNQIPLGSTITAATLTFNVTNETGQMATIGLHRMLSNWSDTDTWNSMTNGIDTESAGTADDTLAIPHGWGFKTFSGAGLVSTLQDWSNGQMNHGWAVFNNLSDALGFSSAEAPTVALRPILSVEFAAAIPPSLDLDLNNSSGATGNDYQFTFTEGDGPTAIADSDTDLADVDSTTFDHVTVAISGLLDGNAETLALDGDTFALATAVAGQDTTGGNYHVVITTGAGTATVTITKQSGGTFTEIETETLIEAIQYQHTDTNAPTDGDRLLDVTVNDGTTDSAAARTTINVNPTNDAPVHTVPGTQTVNEETQTAIAGLSVTDVDAAAGLITTRLQVGNGVLDVTLAGAATISAGANGTNDLTIQGTVADVNATLASLLYTGNTDVTGVAADSVTVTTNDGGNTGTGGVQQDVDNIQIDITNVNDAPVNTVPGAQVVAEDTALNITGLSVNDVDGNLSTVQLAVTQGTVTVTLSGGATISAGANGTSTLTLAGTQADINATLASVSYQGMLNYNGPDTLTMTSTDGNSATDVDGVAITVTGVNDAPVNTVPGAQVVAEDTALGISGISVNDVDGNLSTVQLAVSNGTVTVTLSGGATISAGANGTNTLTLSGSQADINATLAPLSYQGNLNYNGPDTLTVTSTDGNSAMDVDAVGITVTSVNDAPVNTVPGAQVVGVDTPLNIMGVSVNDVDGNLSTVQLAVTQGTVTVTLSGGATISGGTNGTSTLTISGTETDINATLASLIYLGNLSYSGPDTLTVTSTDGNSATDVDMVGITVNVTNTAPVNTVPGAQVVGEDTALNIMGVSVNDVDGNLSTVQLAVTQGTVTVTLSGGATISGGTNGTSTLTISGTETDINATLASLSYQGTLNYNGPDTLTMTSTDGNSATDVDVVGITVTPGNDAPVAMPDSFTVNEGGTNTLNLAGNDSDADDGLDLTSITIISSPTNGTITSINTDGTVTYTHNGSETLADSFTYTINDLAGTTSNTVTVSLTVTPQNDPPIITSNGGGVNTAITVIEGNTAVTDVEAFDAEGVPLTYSIIGGADGALFSIDSTTGILTFNTAPDSQTPGDVGGDNIYDVIVQVSDGTAVDTQAIAVTVTTAPPVVIPPPPPDPAPDPTPAPDDDGGDTEGSEEEVSGGGLSVAGSSQVNGSGGSQDSAANDSKDSDPMHNMAENDLALMQQLRESKSLKGAVGDLLDLLQKPFDKTTFKSEIQSLLATSGFLKDLDRVRDAFQEAEAGEKTYLASSVAASTGLSIGYVFWLLRSGVLLTALLSSLPAWQFVNPLLVLDTPARKKRKKGQENLEDDSVESMFENQTMPTDTSKTKTGVGQKSRWPRRT